MLIELFLREACALFDLVFDTDRGILFAAGHRLTLLQRFKRQLGPPLGICGRSMAAQYILMETWEIIAMAISWGRNERHDVLAGFGTPAISRNRPTIRGVTNDWWPVFRRPCS